MTFAEVDCERLQRFRDRGFAPRVIFDVGASNGDWSSAMMQIFPHSTYHLFEPLAHEDAEYRERLLPRLAQQPAWKLHPVAVGKAEAVVEFRRAIHASGSTALPVDETNGLFRMLSVSQTTLDAVIDSYGAVPEFVKMDIQGGELAALEGMERHLPGVELLLLETWLSRAYGGINPLLLDLMNHLAPRGFFPVELADSYRDDSGNLIAQDVFFVNRTSRLAHGYYF